MIAPLTKFIDWSVLQTAEVIGCLGQMSLIFRMVFLAIDPAGQPERHADAPRALAYPAASLWDHRSDLRL